MAVALALLLSACGKPAAKKVIVFGVDGMDSGFVERHWESLPALAQLRQEGSYSRLATTDPPQSPVAWSSFITGLEPGDHGIFDFVHRDPETRTPFLSMSRVVEAKRRIGVGPWELPLGSAEVVQLRRGRPFWEKLTARGIPVTIVHLPANFPPQGGGEQLAGMGVPDLRGTQGEYTLITRSGEVELEGPANSLRKDRAKTHAVVRIDVDAVNPVMRVQVDGRSEILNEGEWSGWLPVRFELAPHLAATRGMIRVFAKRLHPDVAVYVSPVEIDPMAPALPLSSPGGLAKEYAAAIGRYPTLGIPQDTTALRDGVFTHAEFLAHSRGILTGEIRLLRAALDRYRGGLLFFYFSSVDQNSHVLWGRYEGELLEYYKAVDGAIGEARRREPEARIVVMSDHGFTSFDRAVNLNAWLRQEGWMAPRAWALGLNAVYLAADVDVEEVRRRLLELRDPETGKLAVASVTRVRAAKENAAVAPTLVVGYAAGYRASWATGVGEASDRVFEANADAWIGDHCVDPAVVPGVLFGAKSAGIRELGAAIVRLFD